MRGGSNVPAMRSLVPLADRLVILPAVLLELAAAAGGAAAVKLDLGNLDPCRKGSADEIVVCGSRATAGAAIDFRGCRRLTSASRCAPKRTSPECTRERHVESNVRPDGLVDKRIMITFGIPF